MLSCTRLRYAGGLDLLGHCCRSSRSSYHSPTQAIARKLSVPLPLAFFPDASPDVNTSRSLHLHKQDRLPHKVGLGLESERTWLYAKFLDFTCQPWYHRMAHHIACDKAYDAALFFSNETMNSLMSGILFQVAKNELCRCFWKWRPCFYAHL